MHLVLKLENHACFESAKAKWFRIIFDWKLNVFFSRVREGKRRHKNNQLAFFEIHGDQWSLDTITWQIPTPTKLVSTHFVLHTTTLLGVLRRDESFCLIALTTRSLLQCGLPCWYFKVSIVRPGCSRLLES